MFVEDKGGSQTWTIMGDTETKFYLEKKEDTNSL